MLAPRNRIRNERGFTLVEVTIILLVLVILSMIMLPQLGNFNRLARKVKVYEDVGAICANFKKFLDEVMSNPYIQPGGGVVVPLFPVGLLVGPGTAPDITPIAGTTPRTGGSFPDIWDSTAPTDPACGIGAPAGLCGRTAETLPCSTTDTAMWSTISATPAADVESDQPASFTPAPLDRNVRRGGVR